MDNNRFRHPRCLVTLRLRSRNQNAEVLYTAGNTITIQVILLLSLTEDTILCLLSKKK